MPNNEVSKNQQIKLFEDSKIRSVWDEEEQQWYFSVVDVVAVLTESVNPRDYWFKMKKRVHSEDGIELSTICRQLKMQSSDGKYYNTDAANVSAELQSDRILRMNGKNVELQKKAIMQFLPQRFQKRHLD